ncbi:dipeptide ABC transporter ATP-binding protein [Gordonia sp. SID5947]|uniref:ABC transporter ATP-binding protein n=1 Tax=Gordonia sp. SID5947 TaxID=2690315 RepID=UPI00136B8B08|nr:ABC transporter ATP-binding protein [Gordonia sp. SID5947]MYR07992.1 dipeptide ABC transporter ATP-binding protein [Gordonia sp. SID5947]
MTVIDVRNLRIETARTGVDIVDGVSFTIEAGQLLGVVGESGSGKSTIGSALLGYCRDGARIIDGEILVDGRDVRTMTGEELRQLRGSTVAYVPQDPSASLNPALRIGPQLSETLRAHQRHHDKAEIADRVAEALRGVGLPSDVGFQRRYPHQLSGGQQQRVTIAIALICRPKVVVMDEPTTGLDVTTQAGLLETVKALCEAYGIAGLYISHDLAVVSDIAHNVLVLYAGRVAEVGSRDQVFSVPAHPYTRLLLQAIPDVNAPTRLRPIPGRAPAPGSRPSGCFFAPRCPDVLPECESDEPVILEFGDGHGARCIRADAEASSVRPAVEARQEQPAQSEAPVKVEVRELSVSYAELVVLQDVSISLRQRECVALVGESGSGKTTLSRAIIGLSGQQTGDILVDGDKVDPVARRRPGDVRRKLQYVFQNANSALNPRRTVGASIEVPLREFTDLSATARRTAVRETLERVALPSSVYDAWPSELSGGERQRAAIARALVCEPDVLICDEITSALDVSVQATIVTLLQGLIEEQGLSILFVTHDLALVRSIADRVFVLKQGRVVDAGVCEQLFADPAADYTRQLLADTPSLWQATNNPTGRQFEISSI